jgi:hypothetical protein
VLTAADQVEHRVGNLTGLHRRGPLAPVDRFLLLVLRPEHQLLLGSLVWIRVVGNGVLVTARWQSMSCAFPGGALRCRQRTTLVARSGLRAFRRSM